MCDAFGVTLALLFHLLPISRLPVDIAEYAHHQPGGLHTDSVLLRAELILHVSYLPRCNLVQICFELLHVCNQQRL